MLVDTTFIYALTEPGTRTIRYFGKASNPKKRRIAHIWDAKKGVKKYRVYKWIRKLLNMGKSPDVHFLCEVPKNDYERFERAFIALGRQCGFNLTNGTDGGEAGPVLAGEKNPWFGKTGAQHPKFGHSGKLGPLPPEHCAAMRRKRPGAKSNFHGVALRTDNGVWQARISVSGKEIYIGCFRDEIEAAKAYDVAAKKYHGKFAKLNFPD